MITKIPTTDIIFIKLSSENYGLWTIETHASCGYLPLWANIDSNHAKDQGNVCYGYGDIAIEIAHLTTIQIKCNNEQQRCTANSWLETLSPFNQCF